MCTCAIDYLLNLWHMYTFIINGTDLKAYIYRDSVFQATTTVLTSPTIIVDGTKVLIGDGIGGGSNHQNFMDELSVWSTGLSQEQIDLLYNGGLGFEITGTAPAGGGVTTNQTLTEST